MSKKFLLIIGILLVIIGLIVFYFLFLKKPIVVKQPTPAGLPETEEEFLKEALKPQPKKRLMKISEVPAISPTIKNNSIIYYSPEGLFESNFDGSNLRKISPIVIPNLIKVIWSNDASKAIIQNYDENYSIKKYIYDYDISKSYPLPDNIKTIAFLPNSSKIIFNYVNFNKNIFYIGTSNIDLTNSQKIIDLKLPLAQLEPVLENKIIIKFPSSGLVSNSILLLDTKNSKLNLLLSDEYGLDIKASPNATKFIYSSTNSKGKDISLFILNSNGQRKNLEIKTLVDKCTFSQDNRTIFCAVPRQIPENAILPDDYYKDKIDFYDDIWRINTETGEKKLVEGIDIEINADNLLLSPQENYLFFINKKDGNLYSLKLY